MARKARIRAQSGIYYVALRSDKYLFEESAVCADFLDCLKKEKEDDFLEVYAYCLLSNNAYLVIKEGIGGISKNFMNICARFATKYNVSHINDGAVFKGRFKSVPLEENTQILSYVKKTHRTAVDYGYGIDYEHSSYGVYFKRGGIIDSELVASISGSIIDFKLYNEKEDFKLSDEELKEKIKEMFKEVKSEELMRLGAAEQKILLRKIKKIEGATVNSIARVLGLDVKQVEKS